MNKKQVLVEGKILSYYENLIGEKEEVLVFLHGWMQDGTSFQDIFLELEERNIAYVSLDLPGFGNSGLIHNNMSIEDYGIVVKNFIEKLGLIRPTLIGHSFGGRISIYLGSIYSNLKSIILIGSAGINPQMNPIKFVIIKTGKLVLSLPGLNRFGSKVKKKISSEDYKNAGNMTQIFQNSISNDLRKYMVNISYPTLLIWGQDDDQTPLQEGKIIKSKIEGAIMVVLNGGHFIHQEKPKAITDMILRFTNK